MRREVRRKLEMAFRVQEFMQATPIADPSSQPLLTALNETVGRAKELVAQQQAGRLEVTRASRRRYELRRDLQRRLLRQLQVTGTLASVERRDLLDKYRVPSVGITYLAFEARARAMIAAATADKEVLSRYGLSDEMFQELGQALTEFEEQSMAVLKWRRDHVTARGDLEDVITTLTNQVAALDGLNRTRFRYHEDRLAGWRSASAVTRTLRKNAEEEVPSGGATPPTGEPDSPGGEGPTSLAA